MRKLAESTNGLYLLLDSGGVSEQLIKRTLENIEKSSGEVRKKRIPNEAYQWPLGIGVVFLLLGYLLRIRPNLPARLKSKETGWRGCGSPGFRSLSRNRASGRCIQPLQRRKVCRGIFGIWIPTEACIFTQREGKAAPWPRCGSLSPWRSRGCRRGFRQRVVGLRKATGDGPLQPGQLNCPASQGPC